MAATENALNAHLRGAMALHQAGRLNEAEAQYREILRVNKRHPDATHLLAMLMHQRGDTIGALPILDRALKARPKFPAAQNSRGLMLMALGRPEEATASFDKALAADPSHVLAWFNRGHALSALQRPEQALASYDRALALQPGFAQADQAKAGLLRRLGRLAEALACCNRALAASPDLAEVYNDRGVILDGLGRGEDAFADYARAVSLRPGFAEALNNQGATLDRLGRHAEARESFRRAVASRPDFAGALMNLADTLYLEGRREEAVATVDRRLALDPEDMTAHFVRAVYQLPILYEREEEIDERRIAYEAALLDLKAKVENEATPGRFADAVAVAQPFFLAYQGRSDFELQRLHGSIVDRIMSDYLVTPALPGPPPPGERIRIGIVSGFFRQHPVWRIIARGWITQLDRSRFELIGYYTGSLRDSETEVAAAHCDSFVQGPLGPHALRARIIQDAPHVLIYPEIGMDRTSAWLAAQRLAPLQCSSWGHPDTSGLPSIDAFLSSDGMEPPDGETHYSERLVRLPGLGVYYEQRTLSGVAVSRAEFGLRDRVPTFWCGQSLFKYLPQHDQVFPQIARAMGDCQFAFITYHRGEHVTDAFRHRLARAFTAAGLEFERFCVILPRLDGERFAALAGVCDVGLDSIGWSGGNTTLEAFLHDLPVVTLPGGLMRGRHTQAMLELMGIPDTIAESLDEYVDIAVRLARDVDWRAVIRSHIAEAKSRLYGNGSAVNALMTFLEQRIRSN